MGVSASVSGETVEARPDLELAAAAAAARRWLFEEAAPVWADAGFDRDRGLFAEQISWAGRPEPVTRRLRVQARQIYSFCELGRLGWSGPWAEQAERALDRLLAAGRRGDGLFVHTFDDRGDVEDERCDLYDHAFVLFALAHAGAALNRPDLFDTADALFDLWEARYRRPTGGFHEGEVEVQPPRRQNPHMHLFEAALALWEASGRERWLKLAMELERLAEDRFLIGDAMGEYFDENWSPLGARRLAEPGHCFEWAWLFDRAAGHSASALEASDRLCAFARRNGLDAARGVAVNALTADGAVVDADARLWPQTERLKCAVARWRRTGDPEEAREAVDAWRGLHRYLDTPVRGVWRDRLKADGSWVEEPAPASSFYHIICSLSALLAAVDKD
ncbi:mannose-6-phosphate isomerase [Caulobacter sp. 17J65-9]|nr:AGE family epimerase/isomerase [Caulobacter sp. 17J65-9]NEX95024.1 mannose-6-phosphate isomerase [Caulobacter sp. 17J65-9]